MSQSRRFESTSGNHLPPAITITYLASVCVLVKANSMVPNLEH